MQVSTFSRLFPNIGKHVCNNYRFMSDLNSKTVPNPSNLLRISTGSSSRTLELNPQWLRDHCRCRECYNHDTHQRQFNLLSLPDDLSIKQQKVTESSLQITWADGHCSTYDLPWLERNTYEGRTQQVDQGGRTEKLLWNRNTAHQKILEIQPISNSELDREQPIREVFTRLVKYGFAFVEGVPAKLDGTKEAVDKICRRTTTFYGDTWELGAGMQHQDSGYTNVSLDAHTDTTYLSEPVGTMIFHCLKVNGSGGQSLLVDGFNAARQFKEECPEGYQFLSDTYLEAQYIEPGEHFLRCDRTLKHHPVTKELEQIRFNLYDMAPVSTLPQSAMERYYGYMKLFASIIKRPENELWLQLKPGTMLLFDNFRVLHGRAAYEGTRHLFGTYFSRSDFMSRARVFNLV